MSRLLDMTLRDLLQTLQAEQAPAADGWARVRGHMFERGLRIAIKDGLIKAYSPPGERGHFVRVDEVDAWVKGFRVAPEPAEDAPTSDVTGTILRAHEQRKRRRAC